MRNISLLSFLFFFFFFLTYLHLGARLLPFLIANHFQYFFSNRKKTFASASFRLHLAWFTCYSRQEQGLSLFTFGYSFQDSIYWTLRTIQENCYMQGIYISHLRVLTVYLWECYQVNWGNPSPEASTQQDPKESPKVLVLLYEKDFKDRHTAQQLSNTSGKVY